MKIAFRIQRLAYRKNLIVGFVALALFSILYSLFSPNPVFAQTPCQTGPFVAGITQECPASGLVQIQQLMTRLINVSVTIAFMALTVWLVWGALKFFITSGGDPKALSHAWTSVTWAFLGIFFLILSWLVLKLVVAFTGAPVTGYCLGFPPYCV